MIADPQRLARVVVVDGDRATRELVRRGLETRVLVECCESGEAALAALAREPAVLVISALTLPGLSGIELIERVRHEYPRTEFVVLTGDASDESNLGALRLGAEETLSKPICSEALERVVDRLLARRRLLAENERLREALDTVESCQTLMRCLDSGQVYALALDLLLGMLPRGRGLTLFRRSAVPGSEAVAFRGFSEGEARALRDALLGEKPVEPVADRIEVVFESALHEVFDAVEVDSGPALVVPMNGVRVESGVLWIFEDGRPFDSDEIDRVRLIAAHAELALHNAERFDHAKERAFIDDVTEVYNARYLIKATEREIQRAERYGKDLCVLFLDLDRFKLVNDRFGHLIGSRTLRRLSEVLLQCIRQVDTLARFGGDEFTILLVDTDLEAGLVIAERIRRTVAETLFEGVHGEPIRLSISIGVAAYPQHGCDRDGLLDLSDKAMYRAKSLGRNCVCSASDLND